MLPRFVDRAIVAEGLEETSSPNEAKDLVIKAYEIDPHGALNLNAFEHAVWRVERAGILRKSSDQ